ncbi:unnamed protein product, partial [Staurois parvus]
MGMLKSPRMMVGSSEERKKGSQAAKSSRKRAIDPGGGECRSLRSLGGWVRRAGCSEPRRRRLGRTWKVLSGDR